MRTKLDNVSNQFNQLYFELSVKEINDIYEELEDSMLNSTQDENGLIQSIKERIEDELIEDELSEMEICVVGPKTVRYLTRIEKNKPLMGIAQFCVLPEDVNVSLPLEIPDQFYGKIIDDEIVNSCIKEILINNNYYELKDSTKVKKDSIITYDLIYLKDDFIVNTIKDQTFEMNVNEDLDPNLFIKAKIGDSIILDKEDVNIVAKITRIQNKKALELTNKIVNSLRFSKAKTVEEFTEKIKDALIFQTNVHVAIFFIVESIMMSDTLKFDQFVIDYFVRFVKTYGDKLKESPGLFDDFNTSDKIVDNIKRVLTVEYISKIIELKTDSDEVSEAISQMILDECQLNFLLSGRKVDFSENFIESRKKELEILEYCKDNDIIKNIRI